MHNQRFIPRIDDGTEVVGNLNTSVCGEVRNLNVLHRLRVKWQCTAHTELHLVSNDKISLALVHATKTYCGTGSTAPLILNLCSRQKGMVSFAHQLVYIGELICSNYQMGDGVGP